MLDAIAKLLPPTTKFLHQIAPSVIATLIAAGLISGYNRAFSGHLQQPRMAALHGETEPAAPAATTVVAKPAPVAEVVAIPDEPAAPRVGDKEPKAEAGKDQTVIKVATPAPAPAPRPTNVANPTSRTEPRVVSVPYVVPPPVQPVTAAPMAPPPAVATAPAALPPPVIVAPPVASAQPMPQPMVTVPDRPTQRPPYETQAEEAVPPPSPHGPIGAFVNTLKPSTWFSRAREFGDRIEAAGNEILPNIRQ
jgi:hypothetical protein